MDFNTCKTAEGKIFSRQDLNLFYPYSTCICFESRCADKTFMVKMSLGVNEINEIFVLEITIPKCFVFNRFILSAINYARKFAKKIFHIQLTSDLQLENICETNVKN